MRQCLWSYAGVVLFGVIIFWSQYVIAATPTPSVYFTLLDFDNNPRSHCNGSIVDSKKLGDGQCEYFMATAGHCLVSNPQQVLVAIPPDFLEAGKRLEFQGVSTDAYPKSRRDGGQRDVGFMTIKGKCQPFQILKLPDAATCFGAAGGLIMTPEKMDHCTVQPINDKEGAKEEGDLAVKEKVTLLPLGRWSDKGRPGQEIDTFEMDDIGDVAVDKRCGSGIFNSSALDVVGSLWSQVKEIRDAIYFEQGDSGVACISENNTIMAIHSSHASYRWNASGDSHFYQHIASTCDRVTFDFFDRARNRFNSNK